MPTARPTAAFQRWQKQLTKIERDSITSVILDMRENAWPKRDPDMYTLVQGAALASINAPGLAVNVFIQPHRISRGLGRATRMWFGITQVAAGPPALVGGLLVLKAWTADPGTTLVAAEAELLALAGLEYP
jgi:hypothetical protein